MSQDIGHSFMKALNLMFIQSLTDSIVSCIVPVDSCTRCNPSIVGSSRSGIRMVLILYLDDLTDSVDFTHNYLVFYCHPTPQWRY